MIRIIPTPYMAVEGDGSFSLKSVSVYLKAKDQRLSRAVQILCSEIGGKTGELVPFRVGAEKGHCIVVCAGDDPECESCTLEVTEDRITVESGGAAGAYWGIQSLRQLVCDGDVPVCRIFDKPDFPFRGFYQDITRGRVNRLSKLFAIVDMLSYYKINMLQLYVEDAFMFKELEGIVTEDEALTPAEMLALDDYCYEHFIDLVPSLSTFGHMYTLLQSDKYKHLCELENFEPKRVYWMEKQWHHTIDPYNPESAEVVISMIEQYIPLFRSKYFNICCDETLDLCKGRNAGRDTGEAFVHHATKLISALRAHGKTAMLWGDVCMAHAELVKENISPSDVIVLNWCYHKVVPDWLGWVFNDMGYRSIFCPGTSSWSRFIENADEGIGNIASFAAHAKKNGVLGILNTNWGDFGHICPFNSNLYGALYGAQKSWNTDAETGGDFTRLVSERLYGVVEFDMTETILALCRAESISTWAHLVTWYNKNFRMGETEEFTYENEKTDADAVNAIEVCRGEIRRLEALGRKGDTVIGDLILSAEGIEILNRISLYLRGAEGYCDREELRGIISSWSERYSRAWLRDDKPSQLWRLREFFAAIPDLK